MASVWYLGSGTRVISAANWASAGIADVSDSVWSKTNGFSIPVGMFTAPQLAILDAAPDFNINAPDGPRPGSVVVEDDRVLKLSELAGLGLSSELLDSRIKRRSAVIMGCFDRANVTQPLTPAGTYVYLSPRIVVPPTDYDLTIKWGAWFTVTTAGNGIVGCGIAETTVGAMTETCFNSEDTIGRSGLYTVVGNLIQGEKDIDKSSNWRTFRMIGGMFRDAGSSLVAVIAASTASGGAAGNRQPYLKVVPQ